MSFYDIVIDFLMFDAFDDLEKPPSSVNTVMQSRLLTSGFKETVNIFWCLILCFYIIFIGGIVVSVGGLLIKRLMVQICYGRKLANFAIMSSLVVDGGWVRWQGRGFATNTHMARM